LIDINRRGSLGNCIPRYCKVTLKYGGNVHKSKIISRLLAVCVLCLLPLVSTNGRTFGSEENLARWINDYSAESWEYGSETFAEHESGADGGIRLRSGGEIYAAYLPSALAKEFMAEASVDADGAQGGSISFDFFGGGEEAYSVAVAIGSLSYSVVLNIGGSEYTLSEVPYGAAGEISVRLAFDMVTDFSTYTQSETWNFVAGSSKTTSKRINRFFDADFETAEEKLNAAVQDELYVQIRASGLGESGLLLSQLFNRAFYDYPVFQAPEVIENSVGYTKLGIVWELPDATQHTRGGFEVRRASVSDNYETFTFDNAYAFTLSDKELKQNTEYTYSVTAYREVDNVTNRVACYKVSFRYEDITVKTMKGDPRTFIVLSICFAVVLTGIVALYVYFYRIKAFFKKG